MVYTRRVGIKLGMLFSIALGGCASHNSFVNPDECVAWSEAKFRVPLAGVIMPPMPKFTIPHGIKQSEPCIKGKSIARAVLVGVQPDGTYLPAAQLIGYRAYKAVEDDPLSLENKEHAEFNTLTLSFADYFLSVGSNGRISFSDIGQRLSLPEREKGDSFARIPERKSCRRVGALTYCPGGK